jgi:hypothetical protein
VRDHGVALGHWAAAAARRVRIEDAAFPLALTGGLFRHPGRALTDSLEEAVRTAAPRAQIVVPQLEPAVGALLLAFDVVGVQVSTSKLARLTYTMPPPTLFTGR